MNLLSSISFGPAASRRARISLCRFGEGSSPLDPLDIPSDLRRVFVGVLMELALATGDVKEDEPSLEDASSR